MAIFGIFQCFKKYFSPDPLIGCFLSQKVRQSEFSPYIAKTKLSAISPIFGDFWGSPGTPRYAFFFENPQ